MLKHSIQSIFLYNIFDNSLHSEANASQYKSKKEEFPKKALFFSYSTETLDLTWT